MGQELAAVAGNNEVQARLTAPTSTLSRAVGMSSRKEINIVLKQIYPSQINCSHIHLSQCSRDVSKNIN
jgi:hypothetical protein